MKLTPLYFPHDATKIPNYHHNRYNQHQHVHTAATHHVVGEVEGGVERVRLTLHQVLPHRRRHVLVHHQDHDALVVLASPAGATRHLDVLAGRQLPTVQAAVR